MPWVKDLRSAVRSVIDEPEAVEAYRHDQAAPGFVSSGRPRAVARPESVEEVQAAMAVAALHRVPVVPRGAGSGLTGGANALEGCLVLTLDRLTRIEIDDRSLVARVGAGVINDELRSAAGRHGLWYAPDPASAAFSTIGGNIATNAGGLCCVKYGVTRDALLAVDVVLADGRLVRLGRTTRKGVAGYDLTSLVCGSEGTLGVVTEATVRLLPQPAAAVTLAASFDELGAAAAAIASIVRHSQPSMLELMDRQTLTAVERLQPMGLDETHALVLAQADSPGAVDEVEQMAALCEAEGAVLTVASDSPAESRLLLAARRLAYTALERSGSVLLEDVAVPLGAVPALVTGVAEIAAAHESVVATFGHAGDGNMHPTVVYRADRPEERERARLVFDAIVALGLRLGGTVTGEHGVGLLKRDFVERELGGDVLNLQRSIKSVFDPAGLMNPGKAMPPR